VNVCLSVNGRRGTGKSTVVRCLLRDRRVSRRIILDVLGDYEEDVHVECVAHNGREVDAYFADIRKSEVTRPFSLAYRPDDSAEKDAAVALVDLARFYGNCTVVIEEAQGSCPVNSVPDEIIKCAKRGRHWEESAGGVGLWTVSQRPSDVDTDIRGETWGEEVWFTKLVLPADIKTIRDFHSEDLALAVRRLPKFVAFQVVEADHVFKWRIEPETLIPEGT
jgi:hypothetical protein